VREVEPAKLTVSVLGDNFCFSFSIGGSNFYNPYYQNLTGFATLKILF